MNKAEKRYTVKTGLAIFLMIVTALVGLGILYLFELVTTAAHHFN